MLLIPAIDLKDGHCVRLRQGEMEGATVFSEDPAAMARIWLDKGARRLHLVDLNGAFAGKPKNEAVIKAICAEVGDDIRTEEIAAAYEDGILKLTLPKKQETLPTSRKLEIA